MEIAEFNRIKNEIKNKEIESAEAKGKQKSILETWKNEYGCNSLQEAKDKLKSLEEENAEKIKKRDEYFEKLKSITNWNML